MTNIEITIHCPELAQLTPTLEKLVDAMAHHSAVPSTTYVSTTPPVFDQHGCAGNVGPTGPRSTPPVAQPVMTPPVNPTPAPAMTPPAAQPAIPQQVNPAPTALAPGYTHEQVSKAGADLVSANPGKMPELLAVLQQFGVQAVTELRPDQLGPFATALRGLGAKI